MPHTSNPRGIPTPDGPQLVVGDQVRENFKNSIIDALITNGALSDSDKEGEDYFMISESSKQSDAQKFARILSENNKLEGDIDQGELYFVNPEAENSNYRRNCYVQKITGGCVRL